MSKTLNEVMKEMQEGVVYTKSGKPKKTFSRNDFDKLAKAFVNTPDYTSVKVNKKGDGVVKTEIQPVQEFRKMIEKILRDFGVDKAEAAKVLTESYEIKSVAGLHDFVSELIFTYMEAGKRFDFIPKEDFIGSIALDDIDEENDKLYRIRRADGETKEYLVSKDKHRQLSKKSKCPDWKKTKKVK